MKVGDYLEDRDIVLRTILKWKLGDGWEGVSNISEGVGHLSSLLVNTVMYSQLLNQQIHFTGE